VSTGKPRLAWSHSARPIEGGTANPTNLALASIGCAFYTVLYMGYCWVRIGYDSMCNSGIAESSQIYLPHTVSWEPARQGGYHSGNQWHKTTVTAVSSSTRIVFRVTATGRWLPQLQPRPPFAHCPGKKLRSRVTASSNMHARRPLDVGDQSGKCPGCLQISFRRACPYRSPYKTRRFISGSQPLGAESATAHEGVRSPPPAHYAARPREKSFSFVG